jgi:hypothetical protein
MNTLMAVKARTPPVLMLQNITFHVPGLTPGARVRKMSLKAHCCLAAAPTLTGGLLGPSTDYKLLPAAIAGGVRVSACTRPID